MFALIDSASAREADEGVRIDVSRNGRIKIENRFGNVAVAAWNETYVQVSVTLAESGKTPVTSPIVIDNQDRLLSISVVRRPVDPVANIDLTIRVPDSSNLEIATTAGVITMNGMAQSVTLTSNSGDIHAKLDLSDAALLATSDKGKIRSQLPSLSIRDDHVLQAKLGRGNKALH